MKPEISVVIPTYRRETRLAFALEALARQTIEPERFEVLVVRAAGENGPRTPAPDGLPVVFLESLEPGAARQRNVGWREARAPLVAFTDDDCRPAPGWLAAILGEAAPGVVLEGRTEPDPDELHLFLGLARSIEVRQLDPWHPSCNIAYPRSLLERLGGFDEDFEGDTAGEDTDLALRARHAGSRLAFVDQALVWHAVHPRALPAALSGARRRSTIPLVIARHPEQRDALYGRLFLNRSHAALALGLLGAAALHRRPGLAALSFVPYLAPHLLSGPIHPRGLARRLLHLPERLSLDLAELLSAAVGSARHRRLVL